MVLRMVVIWLLNREVQTTGSANIPFQQIPRQITVQSEPKKWETMFSAGHPELSAYPYLTGLISTSASNKSMNWCHRLSIYH